MIKPKFALLASGYKSEKVYSILPQNGDGDFDDFDRTGTAYRVNEDGILESVAENMPRIDHLNHCPSLLIEDSSTNSFTYSEEFNQSVWSKQNGTVEANDTIAPTGYLTADKFTVNNYSSSGYLYRTPTISTSQWNAFSVFIKNHNDDQDLVDVDFWNSSSGVWAKVRFSFATEEVTTSGTYLEIGTVENYGRGWYRVKFVLKTPSSYAGTNYFRIFALNGFSKSMYVWGGQHEASRRNVSSYIQTGISTATRNSETILGNTLNDYSNAEGTIFVDCEPFAYNSQYGSYYIASIGIGSLDDYIGIRSTAQADNDTVLKFTSFIPYGTYLDYEKEIETRQRFKLAITYVNGLPGNYKVYINGVLETTDSEAVFPIYSSGTVQFRLASPTSDASYFNGRIYDARYYDKELTEAEAIELTTL